MAMKHSVAIPAIDIPIHSFFILKIAQCPFPLSTPFFLRPTFF